MLYLLDPINKYTAYKYEIDTLLEARLNFSGFFSTIHPLKDIIVEVNIGERYRIAGLRSNRGEKHEKVEFIGKMGTPFYMEVPEVKHHFYVGDCLCYINGATNEIDANFMSFLDEIL